MTYDNTDSATNSFSGVVDESNPENEFYGVPLTSPISSNTCDSPLYVVSESAPYASPTMQGIETYPILRTVNPPITYATNGLYDPITPLGSVLHPHESRLHHPLIRAVTLPAHILHNVLHPRIYHPAYHRGIVRSNNVSK